MSPDEVLTEARRLYADGDLLGADRALAVIWRDANSDRPPEVLHLLAEIRIQGGQYRDAEGFLKQAIKLEPNNARWHFALGQMFLVADQPSHAMTSLAQAQRLDSQMNHVDRLYASAAIAAKRPADAEAAARRMLKDSPSSRGYDALSVALFHRGKYKEALAAAEDALKYDITSHGALHSKGAALLKLNST